MTASRTACYNYVNLRSSVQQQTRADRVKCARSCNWRIYNKIVFSYWYFAAKQKSIYDYRCSGGQDRTAGTKPRDTHRSRQDQEDLLDRLVTRVNSQTALLMLAQDNPAFSSSRLRKLLEIHSVFCAGFQPRVWARTGGHFPLSSFSSPLAPSPPFPTLPFSHLPPYHFAAKRSP